MENLGDAIGEAEILFENHTDRIIIGECMSEFTDNCSRGQLPHGK